MRTATGRRVETDRLLELVRLHRMRTSARAVARLLRMGPNTERRYRRALAPAGLLSGSPADLPSAEDVRNAVIAAFGREAAPRRASALDAWRTRVEALLDKGLSARAIFDRLRVESEPFGSSYSSMKRLVQRIRRERGRPDDVAIPVDTAPGEVAQVDFGYAGRFYDPATGVLRRTWVFVAVLCYSRAMFVRLVFDQKVETWLDLHVQAFAHFGGCVECVVPDNTRRAVLRAAFGIDGPTELNRSYREWARHYGVKIDPTPPGSPRKKGKVEAAVKYVLGNGLAGRAGEAIDQAQQALARWNRDVASVRVHGSVRRRPADMFEIEERAALRPLPAVPFEPVVWKKARVHTDCHVALRERLYSVPWPLVHEQVWLRAASTVQVFHGDVLVAEHDRTGPRRSTVEDHLPADRRDLRQRGRRFWEDRAARIGPESVALVSAVFDSDDVLSRLRQVQAIVRHLERYPRPRAEATSRLALRTREHSYHGVKRVLELGLDLRAAPA